MKGTISLLFAAALAVASCGDQGAVGSAESRALPLCEEQPACTAANNRCEGDVAVTCEGGVEKRVTCDDAFCKAKGKVAAMGCRLDQNDAPTCECGCAETESECVSKTELRSCWQDGVVRSSDCTDIECKAQGFKGLAAGKGCEGPKGQARCPCEPSCTVGQNTCKTVAGKLTLSYCTGAGFADITCDEVCAQDGLVSPGECGKNSEGGDGCLCGKACTAADERCAGNVLSYCYKGALFELTCSDASCKQAGFSSLDRCDKGQDGSYSCLCNP